MKTEAPPQLDANTTALFLDFDGTLVEIAEQPEWVEVPAALRRQLASAYDCLAGAMAIVSGRSISALDQLLAPLSLPAAGIHGHQLREPGSTEIRELSGSNIPNALRKPVDELVARYPALRIEPKGASLSLHYRQAPQLANEAESVMQTLVTDLGPQFQLMAGKMVFEVRPSLAHKGSAIARFMELAPFVGRQPVFVGDDVTDEDGFKRVNEMGGWSVLVSENSMQTNARYRLKDVSAVARWLSSMTETDNRCHNTTH